MNILTRIRPLILIGGLFLLLFFLFWHHPRSVDAASYSPYAIEKTVYDQRWDTQGDNSYLSTSGKRLHYDVYNGSGSSNKQGYKIEQKDFGKGKQPYLTFTGWSVLAGYTHHMASNQSTYIIARNEKEQKEKMYRAQMTSLDASKDIEYNRQSSTGGIWNPCKSGVYNKESDTCNMYYKSVGFKAYIPLKELFPDENKSGEWELYIVKRVGTGSKLNVVFDQLITPFEFSGKTFQKGTISLDSGINAKQLKMLTSNAIRRSGPRATDNGGHYFTKGKTYTYRDHSEKYTMIWYGVRSPVDNDQTKWAGSLYWRSLGDPATIRYDTSGKTCPDGSKVPKSEPCTVDVTIRHVDMDTGKLLRTDKKKSTVGDDYSFKPAKNGTFTNSNGIPYTATPSGQKFEGTTGNGNMTFTFTYRAKVPNDETDDNIKIELIKQGENPRASGYFFWELRRTNANDLSQAYVESKFNISSSHYALRNAKLTVMGPGIAKQDQSSISFTTDAAALKNKKLSYNFTYEYTNYYRKYYVKQWYYVNGDPGYWDWYWKYDRTETAWDKGDIFSLDSEVEEDLTVKVDHSQKDTFDLDEMKEMEDTSLVVGKRQDWTNNTRTLNKTYYERFSKPSDSAAKSENPLHAQTYLKMEPDRVSYSVELPSGEHKKSNFAPLLKEGSSGSYYPVDVDKSLQGHYSVADDGGGSAQTYSAGSTSGDTKFVTGQTSANYEDQDGYKGTLAPYVSDVTTPITEKKFVTSQTSATYNQDGFTGTLTPYVYSGSYVPSDTKWVDAQTSPYYNSGGYSGSLSSYVYDSVYTPGDSKWVDNQTSPYYNQDGYTGYLSSYQSGGGSQSNAIPYYTTDTVMAYDPWKQPSYSPTSNGYWTRYDVIDGFEKVYVYWRYHNQYSSGNYVKSGYQSNISEWLAAGGPLAPHGQQTWDYYYSHGGSDSFNYDSNSWRRDLYISKWQWTNISSSNTSVERYQGNVTKPGYYTNIYRYQGNVTKPSSDTRVWRYQGNVTKTSNATQQVLYQGYVTKAGQDTSNSQNNTAVSGNYAFPLQMSRLNRLGTDGNSTTYELNFVSDYFFMSKDFGYVGYYPYAKRVKENLVSGTPLPTPSEMLNTVTQTTSTLFKAQTREDFEDTFMYTDHTVDEGLYGTTENLQRYWIPIDAQSPLENGVEYSNEIELNNMGLSDVSFNFAQKFSFDLYLMGSVYDEVATWEQVEPRADVEYPYSITLTPEQRQKIRDIQRNSYALHGFRIVDTRRLYRDLKAILHTSFGDWW